MGRLGEIIKNIDIKHIIGRAINNTNTKTLLGKTIKNQNIQLIANRTNNNIDIELSTSEVNYDRDRKSIIGNGNIKINKKIDIYGLKRLSRHINIMDPKFNTGRLG